MKFEIYLNGEIVNTKEFNSGSYKIGRLSENDLALPSSKVSKVHALLVIKGEQAVIADLGSSNGIFINGILVKKQRLQWNDEVALGDYILRPIQEMAEELVPAQSVEPPVSYEGNLAANLSPEPTPSTTPEAPPAPLTPKEKIQEFIEQKIMVPFYGIVQTVDWRLLLLSILGIALVASTLLSAFPIVRWGRSITTQESLDRAHTVLAQIVRENYRVLNKTNDYSRLTTELAENEPGFLLVIIAEANTGMVIAPTKLLNKEVTDAYTLIALKKVQEGREPKVSIEKEMGRYIVAQPIYVFSPEENDRVLQAVVLADFEIPSKVYSTFQPLAEAALFAIFCSLLAYFFIFKMFTKPLIQMQEQLDAALKGETTTLSAGAKLAELESLATTIDFTLGKLRQVSGAGNLTVMSGTDAEAEDSSFINSLATWDSIYSDGLLVLDKENKVRFVGKNLEDLVGMRNDLASGQNISEACKDAAFAGTAIDLSDRVVQSLGEQQQASLDINGTNRDIFAVPYRNTDNDIRFILVSVKLGGA